MAETILMCKNKPVYNISTQEPIDSALLPGYMTKNPCRETFKAWMKFRYSESSNSIARHLRGLSFGQGKREEINRVTYSLSLSDCYWIKNEDDNTSFEDISPYYNKFWEGLTDYHDEPIPTLYVPGSIPKKWNSARNLVKVGNDFGIELQCIELCKLCSVPAEDARTTSEGIEFINFTTPDIMLEQADMSGKIDPEDFTNKDIVATFGTDGLRMLAIDAIIGNGDRHAGNFGFLRDSNNGDYISMAPLYDFDHALDSKTVDRKDVLITDLLQVVNSHNRSLIEDLLDKASHSKNELFAKRAHFIRESV